MVRGDFLFGHRLSFFPASIINYINYIILWLLKSPIYYFSCKFSFSIFFPINLYIMERKKLAFKSNFDKEKESFLFI